ncbi:MAG: hypothetical protein HZB91_03910 [Elusimicrobia bacterium]|nr:hypothetical protein [Elusimicrobiota bacterium]
MGHHSGTGRTGTWLALLLFLGPLAAAHAAVVKPEAQGRLTNRYTQDNWGSLEEKRISTSFQMGVRDIFWDKLSADLSLRNDVRAEGKGAKFQENFLKIYTANLAVEKLPYGFSTRLGRQYYYGAEATVNFDGVNVEWQKLRWLQAGVLLGNPVKQGREAVGHLFQGGFVKLMKGYNAHIRAGILRVLHSGGFKADDDVEVAVFRRWGSIVTLRGRASLLNGTPKNAFFNAQFQKTAWGVTVSPSYYKHLFVVDPAAIITVSPYARTFAHYERYDRASLEVSKTLGERLNLTTGGDAYFPRKRQRVSLGLSGWDFPWKGTNFSLFGVKNIGERSDNFSFTGTLGYRPSERFEFSAGTSLNEDVTETFYGRKTTSSRTYFGSFKFAPRKSFDIALSPSVTETSDSGDRMYRVEVRNNWRF